MTTEVLDPDRLEDTRSIVVMMREVLSRVVAGYELAGVPLPPPEKRFTMVGTPVHDCESLIVTWKQAYYGPPGDEASEPQRCDGPRSAAIEVHMVRCIPGIKGPRSVAPKPEAIQEFAELQMQDAWLLLDLAPATESWGGYAPGGLGVIGTVEAGEAQGSYQAVVLSLTMAIP